MAFERKSARKKVQVTFTGNDARWLEEIASEKLGSRELEVLSRSLKSRPGPVLADFSVRTGPGLHRFVLERDVVAVEFVLISQVQLSVDDHRVSPALAIVRFDLE